MKYLTVLYRHLVIYLLTMLYFFLLQYRVFHKNTSILNPWLGERYSSLNRIVMANCFVLTYPLTQELPPGGSMQTLPTDVCQEQSLCK
jgi:hypothetical protein